MKILLLSLAVLCMSVHPKEGKKLSTMYISLATYDQVKYAGTITVDDTLVFNVEIKCKHEKLLHTGKVVLNSDGFYSKGKKIPFIKFEDPRATNWIIVGEGNTIFGRGAKNYDWRRPFN